MHLTMDEIKNITTISDASVKDTKKGKEFADNLKKIETTQKRKSEKKNKVAIGQKAPWLHSKYS